MGEPQCRQGGPRLPAFAVWFAEFGEGLLGALYLAETHKDLAEKIATLEKKYDAQFSSVFNAIRQLLQPPVRRSRTIGFVVPRDRKKQ